MFELIFIAFALASAMSFSIYGLLFASVPPSRFERSDPRA